MENWCYQTASSLKSHIQEWRWDMGQEWREGRWDKGQEWIEEDGILTLFDKWIESPVTRCRLHVYLMLVHFEMIKEIKEIYVPPVKARHLKQKQATPNNMSTRERRVRLVIKLTWRLLVFLDVTKHSPMHNLAALGTSLSWRLNSMTSSQRARSVSLVSIMGHIGSMPW